MLRDQSAEPPIDQAGVAAQRALVFRNQHQDRVGGRLDDRAREERELEPAHASGSRAARTCLATTSSTPFTNAGDLSPAKRRAISTASSITTSVGVLALVQELEGGDAQHRAVDRGQSIDLPVLARAADLEVDVLAVARDTDAELERARVRRARQLELGADLVERAAHGFDVEVRVRVIGGEQHLQRGLARHAPRTVRAHAQRPARERATETQHLDHHVGGFGALVAARLARLRRALQRLLDRLGGEHAERDRQVLRERDAADAIGHTLTDVLEVRCVAAHDHADRDQRVVATAARGALRRERDLERARHPEHVHVLAAELGEPRDAALEQAQRDQVVEARDDHAHANTAAVQRVRVSRGFASGLFYHSARQCRSGPSRRDAEALRAQRVAQPLDPQARQHGATVGSYK